MPRTFPFPLSRQTDAMIHKCRSTQINKQTMESSSGIKGQWYPDRGIRLLDLWWRGGCCAYIIMHIRGCQQDDCQTSFNCSVWLEQSDWKSSWHDISPDVLNHGHWGGGGVLEIQMDQWRRNSKNNRQITIIGYYCELWCCRKVSFHEFQIPAKLNWRWFANTPRGNVVDQECFEEEQTRQDAVSGDKESWPRISSEFGGIPCLSLI